MRIKGFIAAYGLWLALSTGSVGHAMETEGFNPDLTTHNFSESPGWVRVGADDRKRAPTTQFPFSAVGRITFKNGGTWGACTGALVSPRIVLTNGHCVYNQSTKRYYSNVSFSPGFNGKKAPFGTYKAVKMKVASGYVTGAAGIDYGFIVLDKPAGNKAGWLGTKPFQDRWKGKRTWYMSGYGSNYVKNPFDTSLQTYSATACTVSRSVYSDRALFHDCDSGQGSSGSPLFGLFKNADNEDMAYVVGVNYGGLGPSGKDRMKACSRLQHGSCGNFSTRQKEFIGTLSALMKQYPSN